MINVLSPALLSLRIVSDQPKAASDKPDIRRYENTLP